jgi:hypothetical protein
MSKERETIGHNDKGQEVYRSSSGREITVTTPQYHANPEGNRIATAEDVKQAEKNG